MLVTNIFGGISKTFKKAKDWLLGLPSVTKQWTIAAVVLWALATLVGGRIAEAAFIAFFYCLAVWFCFCEIPFIAEQILNIGLIADVIITVGVSLVMPGSVSIGYAMLFFGMYFTCFRKAIEASRGRLMAHVEATKLERKRQKELDKESRVSITDKLKDAVDNVINPQTAELAPV